LLLHLQLFVITQLVLLHQ